MLTTASSLVSTGGVNVVSDKTLIGFKFPESAAYDANAKVLYVSEFGSAFKPTQKAYAKPGVR